MGETGLIVRLLAGIIYLLYRAYYNTLRIRVINEQYASGLPRGQNVLYVSWHSKTFPIFGYARACRRRRNFKIAVLTLLDWKNAVFARWCGLLGFETVPVSGAARAAIRLKRMLQEGTHVALALDGPKGPAGTIKPGAFYLARTTGVPVVAVDCRYQKSFRIRRRWDRYEVPFPFTQATLVFAKPADLSSEDANEWGSKIRPLLGVP